MSKGKNSVFLKSILATLMIMAIVFASSPATMTTSAAATQNIADGVILHAWCWSFNTIRNNMALIAEAGYTSVQTSPITNCVEASMNLRDWYYHYQPTDYKIGNYQLGTEAEFAAMCQEAENYGINIIVDVVANHVTSDYSKISSNIKNQPNFLRTNTPISNWNSRYEITQLSLLGLWDNNTQNVAVQNYIKSFLQRCIQLGADGFRYDAAKHIELPDDGNFGGNFWPNILNNGAKFQYGEVLQDSVSREDAYANYMSVTASKYGQRVRDAIKANNFSVSNILDYQINVHPSKLVTWVESHDTYANDVTNPDSSQSMTDEQIKLAWALIAARAGGTPLFFSRPVGGGGKSYDNRFPGLTQIGDRGSTLFMNDEIVAVNKFRNAMVGESEYLRNPNNDRRILMIERGNRGVVIINLYNSNVSLSSPTNLANGTYTNRTNNNNVFTVSNGIITGILPARSVVVLYNDTPGGGGSGAVITFQKPSNWGSNIRVYIYDGNGGGEIAPWPGVSMTNNGNGTYSYTYTGNFANPLVIFNDGTNQTSHSGFPLVAGGVYNINGLVTNNSNIITIYYYTSWSNCYIHYQIGSGSWTTVPGVLMSNSSYSGYKTITIDLGTNTTLRACFNNGSGTWDNNSNNDYRFNSPGVYTVRNGTITSGSPN